MLKGSWMMDNYGTNVFYWIKSPADRSAASVICWCKLWNLRSLKSSFLERVIILESFDRQHNHTNIHTVSVSECREGVERRGKKKGGKERLDPWIETVVGILRNAKVRNCEMVKCETYCEIQCDWFIFISRDRRVSHFTISGVSQLWK